MIHDDNTTKSMAFFEEITREHELLHDPSRAASMQAYMKSSLPYFGVPKAQSRKIHVAAAKKYFDQYPAQRMAASAYAWDHATHRDHKYAAQDVLDTRTIRGNIEVLPLLTHMIDTGQWWDLVDGIHGQFAALLTTHKTELTHELCQWATHENMWRRRTSIIAQLKLKSATDTQLLTYAIEQNAADKEFFIRKAAGWALREYAKTDEAWVRDFLMTHQQALSPLTIREASKHLLNLDHD